MVDEDEDGMAPRHDEAEEEDWILTSDGDSDSGESVPSSVVVVPPSTYLQALKLSAAALPEHPRAGGRVEVRAATRPLRRQPQGKGRKFAGSEATNAEGEGDYDAQKDIQNHVTRSRKSKQSIANRARRLAAKKRWW